MNRNGRNSIYYKNNSCHIKVNRNSNNNIQLNDSNNIFPNRRMPKIRKEDLLLRKINKNKNNLLQSKNNSNNLSSLLPKQRINKMTNSDKTFQKFKSEIGIIDTLNSLRNKLRKLNNNPNNMNKAIPNHPNLHNNINFNNNSINDYKTKISNIKNRIQNTLSKTSSFNNELKKSLKNVNLMNYNVCSNNNRKKNNILIEETSNDTDVLTESGNINNNNNKETNLYVYRSEVQYPVQNVLTEINVPNNNLDDYNYNKYNFKTLNNPSDDASNINTLLDSNNNLIENISKSVSNSRSKKQDFDKKISNNYFNNAFSPFKMRILNSQNNKKFVNTANNSLKITNKIPYLQSRVSPIASKMNLERNNKIIRMDFKSYINSNNNTKSCHHFYRKNCFSRDKYDKRIEKDLFDDDSLNKEKTVNIQTKQNNKNNIFLNNEEYQNNNYKHYNRKYKKLNYQYNLILMFCDSVEKYLIFILKKYYEYFINQLNNYVEFKRNSKSKRYNYFDNSKNMHNLLIKRLKNKINSKKIHYLENYNVYINLSNYKTHNTDNKLNNFKLISRNENEESIYKKKSNSINKSLNNIITQNKENNRYSSIRKKKNLSHNKIYIPKHKNQKKINKYKTLKIDTKSHINEMHLNNEDLEDNLISETINTNKMQTQDNIKSKFFKKINGNDEIIKNIGQLIALKRKSKNNVEKDNSLVINKNNYTTRYNTEENDNKPNKTDQLINNNINIYSKPVLKNLNNKMMKNAKKFKIINYISAKKNNKEKNKKINELITNTSNKNENKCLNPGKKMVLPENILTKKILRKKKVSYSNSKTKKIIKNDNNNEENNENNENNIVKENNINVQNNNIEKKEEIINEDEPINYNIIRSIIVKDVSSRDRRLNVFIKYYESDFKKSNKENDIKHYNIISNEPINIRGTIKIKNFNNDKKNNRYLNQILSSIIEEDEKSKANPSINSEISEEEEESEKNKININTDNIPKVKNNLLINNLVIYLTNILQNLYDDNKKMILYMFMRNFKKIQNQLYLKNSIIQFNSLNRSEIKENTHNYNELDIVAHNGAENLESNNTNNSREKNNSGKNIYFNTADNCQFDEKINNKNILIGSLLFKDFEINEEEYEFVKPKKSLSSSSINQMRHNESDKNIFKNKNILKNLIIEMNNKNIKKYFKFWEKMVNDNKEENYKIDNGMNTIEKNNRINDCIQTNYINMEDNNNLDVLNIDNGKEMEYKIKEIEIQDINLHIEHILNNKEESIKKFINNFRNTLIKLVLRK